jgi:hypothetical protein
LQKFLHQGREGVARHGYWTNYFQQPAWAGAAVFQSVTSVLKGLYRTSGRLQIFLPGVGQDKASGTSPHQKNSKVLFQSSQSPAQGRSRTVQLLCGSGERARLRDRDEYTYIVEIQVIHAEPPRSAYSLSLASIALAQFYLAHIDLSELARKHLFMKLCWTGKESVKRRKDMEGQ